MDGGNAGSARSGEQLNALFLISLSSTSIFRDALDIDSTSAMTRVTHNRDKMLIAPNVSDTAFLGHFDASENQFLPSLGIDSIANNRFALSGDGERIFLGNSDGTFVYDGDFTVLGSLTDDSVFLIIAVSYLLMEKSPTK